ncbi:TatD family hydrolase [Adhaeribacter pallidiroseus]|uniref:3'-5' ssDNA/RNA exonuclease TatD n=1 Tax=Adhaeribacter pallidiroseus TaxID=2072847 RepID=A0A369QJ98_9BACT|nr:TatD family hydrolase [Adhaeribacter pallidiroseus]RDC63327.1 3'-5' ssDNA/RNA exonuclease TatD [Adhaeribacter pallidiroseus]
MPEYIDSHAHIYAAEFKPDRGAVIRKAQEVGVSQILMPNVDHTSLDSLLQTEADYPGICRPMMGLHPCSVKKDFQKELYLVEEWLTKRPFIAIGETGLDLYWDRTFLPQQKEALIIQLEWAKQYKLPIVLHTRDSFEETYELVAAAQDGTLTGVFHCFSGTPEQAQRALNLKFYLGIGGVSTFKNGGLDRLVPEVSLDHLLLETDCPYLAPVPHRSKRNEPAYLPLIAQRVADIKQIDLAQVAEATTRNTRNLFNL